MPKLFEFAFFPAAKDADKFHLLRLDQLASLLNINPNDSMFLDDRGVERPYQDLDKYIFYSYERISMRPFPAASTATRVDASSSSAASVYRCSAC